MPEETEVRDTVERWAAAVRRKDLPAILAHHAPDLLAYDVPPPFQLKGLAEYERTWVQFFSWASDPVAFEIREMQVTAGPDVAFVAAAMRCRGPREDGVVEPLDFRLTVGLRKIAGQWTITHEHHSVPATD